MVRFRLKVAMCDVRASRVTRTRYAKRGLICRATLEPRRPFADYAEGALKRDARARNRPLVE